MNDNQKPYTSLEFEVLLILNRLRNESQIQEQKREAEKAGGETGDDRKADRPKFTLVKERFHRSFQSRKISLAISHDMNKPQTVTTLTPSETAR